MNYSDSIKIVLVGTTHPGNIGAALEHYSETRNPDAEAMCDLAMYNYIEVSKT